MAFKEALKPKAGQKHLQTIVNAEGKLVIAESREDEMQKVKYDEIIDLLIGAGYFRAKIKGISEFDKVVGGMTWCIDVCQMDLDVDLLFQENSTIGQKIALTEKIVSVLPKMNCPHNIEPHQIQGFDFIHIQPVIEWLVKKSLENRAARGDYLRQYAVHQFNKSYCFPHEKPNEHFIQRALPNIATVQNKYAPNRMYKRAPSQSRSTSNNIYSRVQSTLFEYGHAPIQQEEKSDESDEKFQMVDEAKMKELAKSMMATSSDVKLTTKTVSSLVEMKCSEIVEASENYSNLVSGSELDEENELKRLTKKEQSLTREIEKVRGDISRKQAEFKNLMDKSNYRKSREANVSDEDKKKLKELEESLLLVESLQEQERQFKENCKEEKNRWLSSIRELEEQSVDENEIDREIKQLNESLNEARGNVAQLSRSETKLLRAIDEVPSRAELSQYQRRFLELYNQVSATHRETKQFYALHNSMSDQRSFMDKELSLLNSILEGYKSSLNSLRAKEEFTKQFETIIDSVKHSKSKVESKRNDERDRRDNLRQKLATLIDHQRQYASLLKQFTIECENNKRLLNKLKTIN